MKNTIMLFFAGCDLKYELDRVKGKIYEELIIQKHPPIYNPDQFAEFCNSAGDENIFNHILMSVTSELNKLSNDHHNNLETFFSEVIKNEWLLVLIIDDFTKIHTNRRPNHQQFSNCISMCTIVIKAFKSLKAIKKPPKDPSS